MFAVNIYRGQIDGDITYYFESEELADACAKRHGGVKHLVRPLDKVPETVWGY